MGLPELVSHLLRGDHVCWAVQELGEEVWLRVLLLAEGVCRASHRLRRDPHEGPVQQLPEEARLPLLLPGRDLRRDSCHLESMASKHKCNKATAELGVAGCDWTGERCVTITCDDIDNKKECRKAYDQKLLTCYYDKITDKCMTL